MRICKTERFWLLLSFFFPSLEKTFKRDRRKMNDLARNPKMERWLVMAKSLKGPALAEVICKAVEDPGVYNYGEMLHLPEVQNMSTDDRCASSMVLLRLFAFGTWSKYKEMSSGKPTLSSLMEQKLKALSVASLATERRTIPYDELLENLDIATIQELENLLIKHCIYGGILNGQLDQKARCLHVEDAIARDIPRESLSDVIGKLEVWLNGTKSLVETLDGQLNWVVSMQEQWEQQKGQKEQEISRRREQILAQLGAGGAGGMNIVEGDAAMEEDAAPLGTIQDVTRAETPVGTNRANMGRVSKRRR